jgi:Flp pilus assembly protein TadD
MSFAGYKTPENAALMRKFCSFGQNCEFGEAQRQCGAEPLDLLRWGSTPTPVLLRLLRGGFADIADGLEVVEGRPGRQHGILSRRYKFLWHAFTREMSPEQILQRERARLPRLVEMLRDYIWEGHRIFVRYSHPYEEDPREIADALRALGPQAVLLHVRPATPEHPHATVLMQDDGLLIGFSEWFADAQNIPGTTRPDLWLELCRNALQARERWMPWREPETPRPVTGTNMLAIQQEAVAANTGNGVDLADWAAVAARSPVDVAALMAPIQDLLRAGCLNEAKVLLDAARFRFPGHVAFAIEAARVAQRQGAIAEALERWRAIRERFPSLPAGFTGAASVLREAGRVVEGRELLRDAAQRFPADPRIVTALGWLAQEERDWSEAERHWDVVRALEPGEEAAYTAGARALREQGRKDEAELLLRKAIGQFPDRRAPLTEHAWLAQVTGDWASAVERWAAVRARYPDNADAYVQAAQALRKLGRDEEAEALAAERARRVPERAG